MRVESTTCEKNIRPDAGLMKIQWKSVFVNFLSRNNLMILPLAFFLGRATLVGGVTPYGFALFAAVYRLDVSSLLTGGCVLLGLLTAGLGEQMSTSAIAMILFTVFNMFFKDGKEKIIGRLATIGAFSMLASQMLFVYLQGFLLYDLLRALLQAFAVFLLVFILRNSIPLILDTGRRRLLSNEEAVSVAITAALVLAGFADIQLFDFEIKTVLSILLILLFSYKCGAGTGAAIGVAVGLLISMSSAATPLIIGSYAFCGLLSGILKNLGKVGASLGFILGNAVLTLYINGSTEVIIQLKEIAAAAIIFAAIPQKWINALAALFHAGGEGGLDKMGYSARIKEITVEKLNRFSKAFRELSKTFSEISQTQVVTDKQDISALFDRVADRVCRDCSLCLHCWDRNFYNTYQVMFKIVERLDAKGHVEQQDIPEYFLERCERINDFVEAVNNLYELFKVDMVWKSRVGESRELVSQQLGGLSRVIANLASEIELDIHFRTDMENALTGHLKRAGIKLSEAVVFENKWGKYEVNIFHKSCGGMRKCINSIEKITSEVVGRPMIKESNECCQSVKNGNCILRLIEDEPLRVTTGVARMAKNEGADSGDSYTFMNNGNGKYLIALSDGMGSGHKAAIQSKAAINLLEQFMESGFDKDTSVKLINSILVLKSGDESFSTIDMTVVDLHDGEVEFVKIGAVPTYIKRKDRVEMIKTASLPAGIFSHIDMELVHKKVESGDMIIMMTDGIADCFDKEENISLQELIQQVNSSNPQHIANCILEHARTASGSKIKDDMLVLVAKVWKRA